MDLAASPAERALAHAAEETGLTPSSRELPRLTRLVARALTPGADTISASEYERLVCDVRRKEWASQLMNATRRAGELWIGKADMLEAVSRMHDPRATPEALRRLLDDVVAERLRDLGDTPRDVLEAVQADLSDGGQFLSGGQVDRLAQTIARAFGIEDLGFEEELLAQERAKRDEEARIEARAEARRRRENERLKAWEDSLVPFAKVPSILHCSPREALRWIAENRLPVARRTPQPDGTELYEFDPAELKGLRHSLPEWRRASGLPEREVEGANLGNRKVGNAVIARVAALDRYAAHFRTARSLKRRITLVTGPTNSGKSYTALNALAEAESGLALAPLRLLAHEFREALLLRGVPASLATGEERITMPGARHLAATVEMCPFHNPVDVAIIDEAQMLADPDRGAAWTAAIMGAPARHLFILGAPDCIPLVRRIAELCDDPLDEISLERKSPLRAASTSVKLRELAAGDAVIAFSRREVLDLRAELLTLGRRVAVVYGALSPEVRRAEAARFNDGDAEILVATDAIGMGLNLSIKRVVFSALRKFDGKQTRDLNVQEIKQIGGRAGRYGKHEDGVVAVLSEAGSPAHIRRMLAAPPEPILELRPLVQPDSDIVRAVAEEIETDSLYGVLSRIKRAVLRTDDPNYRLADMDQAFEIASALEGVEGLDLTQRWTYAMCPVDERDNGIIRLTHWAADHAAGRPVPPPGTGRLPQPVQAGREELERAEKRHKRLVAWRWLSLRFPEAYPARDAAESNSAMLNDWIEAVLRQQSRVREHQRQERGPRRGRGAPTRSASPPPRGKADSKRSNFGKKRRS
ncbi:helicase-related protein [Kozakia baliensis]|uniref:helicase-related protein n=1 Tax=Kozakia baliensis TaxID=153496 RepID=UPI0004951DB1|nr:helicase-related protein [Kozakia baliensis]